jgi:hypothetical protein
MGFKVLNRFGINYIIETNERLLISICNFKNIIMGKLLLLFGFKVKVKAIFNSYFGYQFIAVKGVY